MSNTRTPGVPSDDRLAGMVSPYAWDESSLGYAFPDSASQYGSGYSDPEALSEFTPLSSAQKDAVRAALDADAVGAPARGFTVEGFTGLAIISGAAQSAELRYGNTSASAKSTATGYYPSSLDVGGDAWFGGTGRDPQLGNSDYKTILHEIGHTLGLKHAHEVKVDRPPVPDAWDGFEYTVMTYRSEVGGALSNRTETWGAPQTWQMLDIAALQYLYGADFTTNSDATVYSWKPGTGTTFVNGAAALEPGENRIFATIWDGGGKDTYDLSDFSLGVAVDLSPGASSLFSEEQAVILGDGDRASGNIYNALLYEGDTRSLIENALGGKGADRLAGNVAANELRGSGGDDRLTGGRGSDTLQGGAGEDILLGGRGRDKLGGGRGEDIFLFTSAAETGGSSVDLIVASGGTRAFAGAGERSGDRIDLSEIDANERKSGHQTFDFAEYAPSWLEEAGHLWAKERDGRTLIRGTIDAEDGFDFQIAVKDGSAVSASDYSERDFIL
jgi:serralysin